MAQDLTSTIVEKKSRGVGIADIAAAATAATEVTLTWRADPTLSVHVVNGSAVPLVATLKSQAHNGRGGAGDEDNDEAITIPAGETGFFPQHSPGFAATGLTTLVLDAFALNKVLLTRQLR